MNDEQKMVERDELDEFIVEENEPANKKILASIIQPYIKSIGKNKVIDYSEKYELSPAWKKILVYLCCRKVMFIKGLIENEAVGPKGISDDHTGISMDSAKNISRDNKLKGLVIGNSGEYSIPNYRLKKVLEALSSDL